MSKAIRALIKHPLVEDVENEGTDEGVWFIHFVPGWKWHGDVWRPTHSRTVDNVHEAREILRRLVPCDCPECVRLKK